MNVLSRVTRFRYSFRSKIFIAFSILTALITAVFMAIVLNNELKNYHVRADEKARLLATMFADTIRIPLFSGDVSTLQRLAGELLSSSNSAKIVITDQNKRVLVEHSSSSVDPHHSPNSIVSATATVCATTLFPTVDMALSGTPSDQPVPFGTVQVFIDTTELRKSIRNTLLNTFGAALLFWGMVLLVTYPVLRQITRSFETLTHGLDSMMQGDFSLAIPVEREDEAGRATQAVNRLAAALEERDAENRALQAELLSAMRLEMQEEKRTMMAKMIQTNRMTSLGLLISSMAHNINTPNGAIRLSGQFLQRSYKDLLPVLEGVAKEEGDFVIGGLRFSEAKYELARAADSICHNAERVERVILDLRAYNLGERSEYAPGVSVNQSVEGALTIIRAHGSQSQVSVVNHLAPNLPTITGNMHQIEQVVVNLLLNAMQATSGEGGAVSITTQFAVDVDEVQIVVADEGEGLPAVVVQHLFEPFTSTRIDKGGSGLGLYISNFIITEHKGYISFAPNSPQGTVVTVHLPLLYA